MADAVNVQCEQHANRWDCPDALVHYWAKFREYGLIVHDGGSAMAVIDYCPWCGARLPTSLRYEWFDRLDQLGLEPDSPWTPEEMRSDKWWREQR